MDLKEKRILITGGQGFLGRHLVKLLENKGCQIFAPTRSQYDLTKEASVQKLYLDLKPNLVIHLAAAVGGIKANKENPAKFYYDNLMMGTLLMEYAYQNKVEKFVAIGTICAYPKFTPIPFKEEDLWIGYPEETNAAYGLTKKMLLVQAQAYRQQYGFNAIYLLPTNLYGPQDNFDLNSGHVVSSLIRKCLTAVNNNDEEIFCWGDGSATRDFLYVEDCAQAIFQATLVYNGDLPINLSTGIEVSIKQLVELIGELTGFRGRIIWEHSELNGQPRRCVDASRAKELLDFSPKTPLKKGLQDTIAWLRSQPNYF